MAFRILPNVFKYASVGIAAIALSACGTTGKSNSEANVTQDEYREAIDVFSNPTSDAGMDPIAAAAFWGTRYNTDQSNPEVAVKFSHALRKIGSTDEALGVIEKTAALLPRDTTVSLEYGKVLVDAGRAFEAVRHLETASAAAPSDWRALSAYGVALDQIGEHVTARKKYDRALTIAPNAVTVMNNKGLSYALEGDLSQARHVLRNAASQAGGDARVRQNLALVLALSGDMKGAERLARSDLPPQVADNNIDYFRQLMNQPAYWGEYAASDASVPNFDDAPAAPLQAIPTPPTPRQKLEEEPKPQENNSNDQPIALIEVAPVTNASMGIELKDDNE